MTKTAFAIGPIGEENTATRRHADMLYEIAVEPACEKFGYEIDRADRIPNPGMITDSIFKKLLDADICVADLSFLNPNAFYELGVRHAAGKPTIHVASSGTKLPFDNHGHNAIFVAIDDIQSLKACRKSIEDSIKAIEAEGFEVSNPLTQALGRAALKASGDEQDQLLDSMLHRIHLLESGAEFGEFVASAVAGQGPLATATINEAAALLRPYFNNRPSGIPLPSGLVANEPSISKGGLGSGMETVEDDQTLGDILGEVLRYKEKKDNDGSDTE